MQCGIGNVVLVVSDGVICRVSPCLARLQIESICFDAFTQPYRSEREPDRVLMLKVIQTSTGGMRKNMLKGNLRT